MNDHMKKIIIGIDPGCTGSIVALNADGSMNSHIPMPVLKTDTDKRSRIDGAQVAEFFRNFFGMDCMATVEHVGPMPKDGVTNAFTFGHGAGVIEGVLQAFEIPYTKVRPQAWKKKAGLIGKDKDAARIVAIKMYPELRILALKGKGQAVADAILIARHGFGLDTTGGPA